MGLSTKVMSRSNWLRVEDREYAYMMVNDTNFSGAVGLINLKSVTEPAIKVYDTTSVKIIDNGYYWLQFAPSNKNYWLTVMYNQLEEIVQFYFDITDSNTILANGESWFTDLFLDIVLLPDGRTFLLDEDELYQALCKNEITKEQYDIAYQCANKILMDLDGNNEDLTNYCNQYFQLLKHNL
jgi:predicted RNA-binding protein associated with RNAse of E/G family